MGYLFLLLRLNSYIFYHSIAEILVSNNVRGAVYNLWSKYGRIETVGVRNNVENNHEAVNRGDHPLHERLTTPRTLMQVHDMFHSYSWTRYHTRAYAFRFCNFGHDCDERQWTSNNRSYIAYFLFVTCSWFLIHDKENFNLRKKKIKKKKKKKERKIEYTKSTQAVFEQLNQAWSRNCIRELQRAFKMSMFMYPAIYT